MLDEKMILYFVWVVTIFSLFLFMPKDKDKVRLAWVAFLFEQVLSWPLGLLVADKGWIQYPVTLYENAAHVSFTYEYLFLPVICAYFMVYFPNEERLLFRTAYYALFCTALTLIELLALHYTNLVMYVHWNAMLTWVTIFVTFFITRKFCLWFFKSYNKGS